MCGSSASFSFTAVRDGLTCCSRLCGCAARTRVYLGGRQDHQSSWLEARKALRYVLWLLRHRAGQALLLLVRSPTTSCSLCFLLSIYRCWEDGHRQCGAGEALVFSPIFPGSILTFIHRVVRNFCRFTGTQSGSTTDPVIAWFNGGPGCSSLGGLLSENGPFYPDAQGNLVNNPYAWNLKANVLYIESPVDVGFSIAPGSPRYNDTQTMNDNYAALELFFAQFPQFANNKFILAGESYAGHYVPMLARRIWDAKQTAPNAYPQKNFRGFLVGNPSTNSAYDFGEPLTRYYQSHGLLRLDDNDQNDVSGNFDPYDILIDVCNAREALRSVRYPHPLVDKLRKAPVPSRFNVPVMPACIDNHVTAYLNRADVQSAIHAVPVTWVECGGPAYDFGQQSMIPYYKFFHDQTDLQVMVYSGDADTVINFISTQTWILSMNLPTRVDWAPWYATEFANPKNNGQQVAGWHMISTNGRFAYRTVKGAGHMVPWWQPAPAWTMLESFLKQI